MTKARKWFAALALVLNLAGTICLAWSFQGTSSAFRLITATDTNVRGGSIPNVKAYALCADQFQLSAVDTTGNVSMGTGQCALWDRGQPAAIVVFENPKLFGIGLVLFLSGFVLQLILVVLNP